MIITQVKNVDCISRRFYLYTLRKQYKKMYGAKKENLPNCLSKSIYSLRCGLG